jgi:hypothetical protein
MEFLNKYITLFRQNYSDLLKNKGDKAEKDLFILTIYYYNHTGTISHIECVKYIKKGDKISLPYISGAKKSDAKTRKFSRNSRKISKKPISHLNSKKINKQPSMYSFKRLSVNKLKPYDSRSTYVIIGAANKQQIFKLIKEHSEFSIKRVKNIFKYCNPDMINDLSIDKGDAKFYQNIPISERIKKPLIHISPNPLHISMMVERTKNWFDSEGFGLSILSNNSATINTVKPGTNIIAPEFDNLEEKAYFNPNGFWFSVGSQWASKFSSSDYEWLIQYMYNADRLSKPFKSIPVINNNHWYPAYVYEVDISDINLYKITNCDDIHNLYDKYKNPKADKIGTMYDWNKVKKDYDGIINYYWNDNNITCCEYCKKHGIDYYDDIELLGAAVYGKIGAKDMSSIWQTYWDASSGVIWKNFKNIKIKLLDI